jgi:hypothetical protein
LQAALHQLVAGKYQSSVFALIHEAKLSDAL